MSPRDFGILMACAEHQVPAEQFPHITGMAVKMASAEAAPAQRLLVKAAHACLVFCKQAHTAPAFHLSLVAEQPVWNDHCREVAQQVSQTLQVLEPMHKQAFAEVSDGIGAAGRGALYGSVGAGAGVGALYWLLSRHANQEAEDIESKKNQVRYYHNLSRELNDGMRRKYHYDPQVDSEEHSHVER